MTKTLCKGQCNQERYIVNKKYGLCQICNKQRLEQRNTPSDPIVSKEIDRLNKQISIALNGKAKDKYKDKPVATLKKWLWEGSDKKGMFNLWVKLERSQDGKWCNCMSCNKPIEIGTTDCQAGHLWPKKSYPALYFWEDCVWPQCYYCNGPLEGNRIYFERNLIQTIGKERVQWMEDNKKMVAFKWTRADLIEKIEHYKQKLKELKI